MERLTERPDTSADEPGASTERRTIAYQPALDGVRAIAVLAVLLFHAEVAGFDGGYLGVSVFFTLSGFLITSLLAAETESAGRVGLGNFYARRARRLLPASVLLVVLVIAATASTDWFDAVADLRSQVVGSLLQVANWVLLANGGSYQELLQQAAGAASPLEHYWSLAIEEQFYWLWPIAFVGLWRVGRTLRGRIWAFGVVTVCFAVAAPVIASVWGSDAAYWASPARAAEILVGAFVAVAIIGRRLDPRLWILAPLTLMVLAVCVVTFPTAGGPAYAGWMPAIGVVSALLLLGLQVESPVRRACSTAPLVWLGKISYGVYLFHWPIFVVMNEDRMGVDGPVLLVFRLGATLVIAQLSYMLYEQPIRRATRLTIRPTMALAGAATAVTVALGMVVVPGPSSSYWEADSAAAEAAAIDVDDEPLVALAPESSVQDSGQGGADDAGQDGVDTGVPGTVVPSDATAEPIDDSDEAAEGGPVVGAGDPGEATPSPTDDVSVASDADVTTTDATPASDVPDDSTTNDAGAAADVSADVSADISAPPATLPPIPELSRPVRIIVAGDSTAEALGAGVLNWAAFAPDLAQAELRIEKGCGFVRGGDYLLDGQWFEVRDACGDWLERELPNRVAEARPDVVMMMTTSFDVLDHRFDDGDGSNPAAMRDRILSDFAQVTDEALANGAGAVVWIKAPLPNPLWFSRGSDQEQPDRHAVLHSVMDEIAAERPGSVYVIDLLAYFDEQGISNDVDVRPDGVHMAPSAATDIVAEYLGEQLVRAALDLTEPA